MRSRTLAGLALIGLMAGCSTPGSIVAPSSSTVDARRVGITRIADLPRPSTRIHPGDTLRIVRDAQDAAATLDLRNLVEDSQTLLYVVRSDGTLSYRHAGRVAAAGKTPDELSDELRQKLAGVYRDPGVTINIVASPSSKVVIGGAVRAPQAFDLNAVATLEQALFAAGGLLPAADGGAVALLRLDDKQRYQVHFLDFAQLLAPEEGGRSTVALQRGDILFVPKSGAGNAADAVDLYINQLLPFARSLGVSFTKAVD